MGSDMTLCVVRPAACDAAAYPAQSMLTNRYDGTFTRKGNKYETQLKTGNDNRSAGCCARGIWPNHGEYRTQRELWTGSAIHSRRRGDHPFERWHAVPELHRHHEFHL